MTEDAAITLAIAAHPTEIHTACIGEENVGAGIQAYLRGTLQSPAEAGQLPKIELVFDHYQHIHILLARLVRQYGPQERNPLNAGSWQAARTNSRVSAGNVLRTSSDVRSPYCRSSGDSA